MLYYRINAVSCILMLNIGKPPHTVTLSLSSPSDFSDCGASVNFAEI
ncbi:MAG: hypothetical protein ACLS48_05730 [[Eubacterium] siraeum]